MCYPAKCGTCGQTTWAGCGKHVPSVYEKIPKDKVCMCKGWPGVELPKEVAKETGPVETTGSSAPPASRVAEA